MRFILADTELTSYEGHYHHYAAHCLLAAAKRGYEPVLATNTDYRLVGFPPKTFSVYSQGVDFYHMVLNEFRWFSTRAKIWHKVLRRTRLRAIDTRVVNRIARRFRPQILRFSQETSNLLAGMRLDKDDVVFFPTANLVTVMGICDYVSKNPHNAAACWCFLFRQALQGSPHMCEPDLTPYAIRLLRTLFSRLAASDMRPSFFTDSEQLARDYDQVAPGLFRVLPIPHTDPKPAMPPAHDVLTTTYVGQARINKGYHHLPSIISKLRADWVENGKMRFVIQSHIRSEQLPEVEPIRERLESLGPGVILTRDLQTDEEYRRMLWDSDIVLMPYNPEAYFVQTSGICAEALARGIPVVVPGGTWLARQFARATYEYQDSFGKSPPRNELAVGGDLGRREEVELPCRGASHIRVKAVFGDNNTAPFFQACVTQRGDGGNILAEDVAVLDRVALPYATCLMPLEEGAARLQIDISHVAKGTVLDLRDARATLFGEDPASPLSAVGMIYGAVESIPDCIKNMASNYAHYRDSARVFSDAYYRWHNADSLIAALTATRRDTACRKERAQNCP